MNKCTIIYEVCRNYGITQKQLAAMLDAHPVTLSKWSAGTAAPGDRHRAILQTMHAVSSLDTRADMRPPLYAGKPFEALCIVLAAAVARGRVSNAIPGN